MNSRNLFYTGVLFTALSIQAHGQSRDVIWNGKGDAKQSVSHIKTKKNGETQSSLRYHFKNVRFGSMVDSGSFYLTSQEELTILIEDLQGAIAKSKESSSFEWSRGKYTIKSGGNNSPKKGTFKLWIGDKHCPMDKKNAKKLIKAIEPIKEELEEA